MIGVDERNYILSWRPGSAPEKLAIRLCLRSSCCSTAIILAASKVLVSALAERVGRSAVIVFNCIFEPVPINEQGVHGVLAALRLSRRF